MNSEAAKLRKKREEEAKALGGEEAYRLHALQHLKLKTVVKESHASTVHTLAFNHTSAGCDNLFATVGGDQATIYDDNHMADYIGVVVHFSNKKTEHVEGGELQTVCWINSEGWTSHPHGDACLAVSGADPNISIISVVEAAVIKFLKGHTKDVVDMSATSTQPKLLLSLSRDGNVRLWDVPAETCLSSINTDATCLAMAPDGESLMIGTSRGRLLRYLIGGTDSNERSVAIIEASKEEFKVAGGGHSEAIDCMRFLPDNRLATKSSDGRMFVWNLENGEQLASWKVPGCNGLGGFSSRCQFSSTADGKFISVGNASGDCYVYDTVSGKREAHVSAIRVSAPVRACALSADCRHLVAAVGKGFLFRFEYLGQTDEEETPDENADGNVGEEENAAGEENGAAAPTLAVAEMAAAGEPMES